MRFRLLPSILGSDPDLPTYRKRSRSGPSPTTLTVLVSIFLYGLVYLYFRSKSARDPTAYFFDRKHGYAASYSKHRTEIASEVIKQANAKITVPKNRVQPPELCIGIASVSRRNQQYLSTTVGSIVEALTSEERGKVFLTVLLAHTNPDRHPNHDDAWLPRLTDKILSYNQSDPMFDQLKLWEEGGLYRNKTIYDYTYLLQDCFESGAEYVLMLEDDTVAARDWYVRMTDALKIVEERMRARGRMSWVYLRLFYVEDLLGWNSEEWAKYLFWSLAVWSGLTYGLLCLKARLYQRSDVLNSGSVAFISGVLIPLSIGLYFMAGRQTVSPISRGVHEMNRYGCCSQALVFSRRSIPIILEQSDLTTDWLVDMMIEQIADKKQLDRWVLVPAVFQHIGTTSSKGYGFDSNARELWNFRFEDHSVP